MSGQATSPSSKEASRKSPTKTQKVHFTVEMIETLIRRKIQERTPQTAHEIRQAYNIFGRPASGITFDALKLQLRKFGISMDDTDLRHFFQRWDNNGDGTIDFYEFIQHVLPCDYPKEANSADLQTTLWQDYQKMATTPITPLAGTVRLAEREKFNPLLVKYPNSLNKWKWDNNDMIRLIRQKITERGQSSKDLLQQAYALFGRPSGGLSYEQFRNVLTKKFGLPFTDDQLMGLFSQFDEDGNHRIDFYEFIAHVMPRDYSSNHQWQHGEVAMGLSRQPVDKSNALTTKPWSHEMIRSTIQRKITERGQNSKDLLRQAYFLFGRPKEGITFKVFQTHLLNFGIDMSEQEMQEAFDYYDGNGNGVLEFYEFIAYIMPPDYPGQEWNEEIAKKQATWWKQKEAINRVPLLHENSNISLVQQPIPTPIARKDIKPLQLDLAKNRPTSKALSRTLGISSSSPSLNSPKLKDALAHAKKREKSQFSN